VSAPDEPVDDGWDDAPDGSGDASDDGPDDAGPDAAIGASGDAAAPGDAPKKRRRRRRRRREGGDPPAHGPSHAQPAQRPPQPQRPPQQQQPRQQAQRPPQGQRPPQPQRQPHAQQHARSGRDERRPRDERARRDDRGRHRDPRESRSAIDVGGEHDLRADDDILRGDPYATHAERGSQPALAADPIRGSQPRLDARGSQPSIDDDEPASEAPAVAWGSEDDSPAPSIALAPDLPLDPPAGDPDPVTSALVDGPGAQLGDDVANVVGVRFVPAGRIQWCDAGEVEYAPGERVLVDSDRGQRLAWIATPPTRRPVRDRSPRRVIRRAHDHDVRGERDAEAERARALRVAKDVAGALRLPLKVFRVEKTSGRLNVYYTSDERLDLRDFVREVGQAMGMRLELRQLGVRDEAKVVGGIGSCGLTLCCSTWLPEFVPVSIKMAKDQGLVLSPTKVSGQCGRLKCCLVYEQAGYAELRKGLPKLGKRVISARGDGRVVEVDVLRQRVRVSYGPGDTEVLPATEVKPMFPSGNQPREPEPDDSEPDPGLPDS
jgi:cell fate regulator YaaT (PSP1 superfamily)